MSASENSRRPSDSRQKRQLEREYGRQHPEWNARRVKRAAARALRAIKNGTDTTRRGNSSWGIS